jgi:hypothetical protein
MIPYANSPHPVSVAMRAFDAMAENWRRANPTAGQPTALRTAGYTDPEQVRRDVARLGIPVVTGAPPRRVCTARNPDNATPASVAECDDLESAIPRYLADSHRMRGLREYLGYCRTEIRARRTPQTLRAWADRHTYAHTSLYRALREARGTLEMGGAR